MHTIKQGFAWIEWNGINAAINVYPTNDYFLQSVSDWWKLDIHVSFHYPSIDTLCAFVVLPFFWIYFVLSAFSDNCADIECTGIKWLNQSSYIVHTQTKIFKVWSFHSFDEFFATLDFFFNSSCRDICTYCVYGCTVTWGQQPRKFLSITEPRSISRKNPVVLFWVSPNWIIADVLLPKSLLNAKDL